MVAIKLQLHFDDMIVNIWDAETYLVDGNFILEDMIPPSGCVTALDQLVVGNTQLLLAVSMQNEVRVYGEYIHRKNIYI
jgi:hypothetical protein